MNIIAEYEDNTETIITLDWDPPQGIGPEAIVDNYTISISPTPPDQPAIDQDSRPWNVTLGHTQLYTINATAINCAGESEPSMTISKYLNYFICLYIRLLFLSLPDTFVQHGAWKEALDLKEAVPQKDVLNFATTILGAQYVIISGRMWMLRLPADIWDCQAQVRYIKKLISVLEYISTMLST